MIFVGRNIARAQNKQPLAHASVAGESSAIGAVENAEKSTELRALLGPRKAIPLTGPLWSAIKTSDFSE